MGLIYGEFPETAARLILSAALRKLPQLAKRLFRSVFPSRGRSSLVGFEFEFDPEKVPGGVSAPRVELSPGVVADAARKSLRDAARADERAEAERRREENLKAVAEERARRGGRGPRPSRLGCPNRLRSSGFRFGV